jgi:hypothetical protein
MIKRRSLDNNTNMRGVGSFSSTSDDHELLVADHD